MAVRTWYVLPSNTYCSLLTAATFVSWLSLPTASDRNVSASSSIRPLERPPSQPISLSFPQRHTSFSSSSSPHLPTTSATLDDTLVDSLYPSYTATRPHHIKTSSLIWPKNASRSFQTKLRLAVVSGRWIFSHHCSISRCGFRVLGLGAKLWHGRRK